MSFVGFIAIGWIKYDQLPSGKLERLIAPMDYQGNLCGHDDGVRNLEYGYYLLSGNLVCVESCPSSTDYDTFICEYDQATASPTTGWQNVELRTCLYQIKTTSVLNRCMFDTSSIDSSALSTAATTNNPSLSGSSFLTSLLANPFGDESNQNTFLTAVFGDIYNFRGVIFGFGVGVAIGISFLYVLLLRIPGVLDTLIWGIIFFIFASLATGAIASQILAKDWEDDSTDLDKSETEISLMKAFSAIVAAIAFLYVCVILYLRKKITLAINVTKEAGHTLTDIPAVLTLPLIQAVGFASFLTLWLCYVFYLVSSGDLKSKSMVFATTSGTTTVNSRYFEYGDNTNYAFIYMFFCFLWTSQFIIAHGQLIIAMTFSAWYFTKGKERQNIGNGTFIWAFSKSWKHAGTTAFGSLIIAIVQFIRAILAYIQKQSEKEGNSKLVKYLLCCCQCCLWCLESCIKFLNKNAYIQTAIYGDSFCKSARSAFMLILRNMSRVFAVSSVSALVTLLGKLLVPIITTFGAYLVLAYGYDSEHDMDGISMPLLFVFILSYFIGMMFNDIYAMGIQTILLCYIADEEMFSNPFERFAPGSLKATMTGTKQKVNELHGIFDKDEDKKDSGMFSFMCIPSCD